MTAPAAPLLAHLPDGPEPDLLLDGFVEYALELGVELYEAQEDAILELFTGHHVILTTPTGSGKSMVALAAHFESIAKGERSIYTAPIKALVSEKFFELCRALGSHNVGMVTGDAAVNPTAPVICCTQEILANMALRAGDGVPFATAVIDEFHFYGDRDRGWAWQVPLLEMTSTKFLLMSATLGPTKFFAEDLERRSGRPVSTVSGAVRPVPLTFEYRETTLHESLEELIELDRVPVYIVHFTQQAATERAQALTSLDVLTKQEKALIREELGGFRFDSPFGKDLQRFITSGVGVHHAGLLPKYRLLVERLAQRGLLKLICGTDTLGVGVNVPIRTVLFTQLCKFDGRRTRLLSVRDFQQIAGRAGRRGFDDLGHVWCQAPEHVVENNKALARAGDDPKKRRKVQRRKPPERGYVHWDDTTFQRLQDGQPEALRSRFEVNHSMVLNMLDRPGDGCRALRHLVLHNHEGRPEVRRHVRRAVGIYRSLRAAEVIETLPRPDIDGRLVRVNVDLQAEFNLTQTLSPFVLDAVDILDPDDPGYSLDVLSIVESVLEQPMTILLRQREMARTALLSELKSDGVPYEERMERLAEVEWPKPLEVFLTETFDAWSVHHPWLTTEHLRPKSVARDLFERAMTFREFVNHYGLRNAEGLVLRYLTDVYKGLVQTVPSERVTTTLDEIIEWLGAVVRQTDSSLVDEWERLTNPDVADLDGTNEPLRPSSPDITTQTTAFTVMVRNELFRWVQLMAREDIDGLATCASGELADPRELEVALAPYWDEFDAVITDPSARAARWFVLGERTASTWSVEQIIVDPEEFGEWRLVGSVDLEASRETGEAVVRLLDVRRL